MIIDILVIIGSMVLAVIVLGIGLYLWASIGLHKAYKKCIQNGEHSCPVETFRRGHLLCGYCEDCGKFTIYDKQNKLWII